ncbi:Rrf2 family transcriptional regulator [Klebsiella aerogenes]|uniref:Rrf2 family transcriptional regulator n=1 Tax=Klebsiella aerogenes TaxID=548 RepID=UPI0034D2E146
MKYTKRTDAAIQAMASLCASHSGTPVPLQTLAKPGLSVTYLEKLFSSLRTAGLIVSTRGPGGGYQPASDNTTVGDVVRAFSQDGFLSHPAVLTALDSVQITDLQETPR